MSRHRLTGSSLGLSIGLASRRRPCGAASKPAIESLESRLHLSATWFVAPNGSDASPGTLASPFKTIQHAADQTQPGDTVMIRGGVYRETVTVSHSGTVSQPIVFEPYQNESVTVDGADLLSGWTKSAGSVWTAKSSRDLGAGNNQVFVDGQMMNEARWPNTSLDLSHQTLATVATASSTATTCTVRDAVLTQPAGFWVGATIHIGPGQAWVTRTASVTASGPGWVTFSYTGGKYDMPTAGNRFYLSGPAATLDAAGEWYRASDGTLSLWTPTGDSPANHTVQVKSRAYAFDLSAAAYIQIQRIHIFAATIETSGISTGILVNQITAEYLSQFNASADGWSAPTNSGIMLMGSYDSLANSVIAYSAGDGVFAAGWGSRVLNNVIHDVDYSGGNSAAVRIGVSSVTVDHNTIYNCGRDGVYINQPAAHITNNLIHDFSLQTTDSGGIYTYGIDGGGTEIAGNTVYNGTSGGYGATGIFLDNNSSNFIIDHNITYNVNSGLKMNVASRGNTVVNNTLDGLLASVNKSWGPQDWTGTVVENNVFTHAVWFGDGGIEKNNVSTTSGFANAAAGNFALVAGSPAIGAGAVMAPYTKSAAGSAPDAGALAFGQASLGSGAVMSRLPADPSQSIPTPVSTPPTVGGGRRSAASGFAAASYDAKQGNEAPSEGGLGFIYPGDWLEYTSVDFGTGVKQVQLQMALKDANAGQKIVLRLDSPTGAVIGTLTTTGTGGWSTYQTETAAIAGATGVHTLYLCMTGTAPIGNIGTIRFQ